MIIDLECRPSLMAKETPFTDHGLRHAFLQGIVRIVKIDHRTGVITTSQTANETRIRTLGAYVMQPTSHKHKDKMGKRVTLTQILPTGYFQSLKIVHQPIDLSRLQPKTHPRNPR